MGNFIIMEYRQLGYSSLMVSRVSFGCMSLSESEIENARVIHRALELGINYFDTADMYEKGLNEEKIARLLKGRREQVVVATKVGNRWRADGKGLDWDPRKEYILQSVEGSLKRLQTDRIDLYQLHGGTMEDPIDETIEAFEYLQQQGKIRYYGISSIRPAVIAEWARRSKIVSVMMQYSLLDRRPEESCLDLLRHHGIGVLARGSLAKGLLTGKAPMEWLDYSAEEVRAAAEAVRMVAQGDERGYGGSVGGGNGEGKRAADRGNLAQTAVRFVLQNPAITSAVVGLRTVEQLEDLFGGTKIDVVSDGEKQETGSEKKGSDRIFTSLPETEIWTLRKAIKQNHYK